MSLVEQEEQLELLSWAFNKGYSQGKNDSREGIYIKNTELAKHFMEELKQQLANTKNIKHDKKIVNLVSI